jgi:hypothetical protein
MQDTRMAGAHSIVVLISARGGGDWPPVVALAVGLQARGHAVCLVCDTSTAVAVRSTGLPTVCIPPELEQGDIRPLLRHLRASGQEIRPTTPKSPGGVGTGVRTPHMCDYSGAPAYGAAQFAVLHGPGGTVGVGLSGPLVFRQSQFLLR